MASSRRRPSSFRNAELGNVSVSDNSGSVKTRASLESIATMCRSLQTMLEKGFGPNSLQTLLSSSSGKISVTSDGMHIVNAMNFAHPVGKMIVDSIAAHHRITGNNSKCFVLILSRIFDQLQLEPPNQQENDLRIRLSINIYDFASEIDSNIIPRVLAHTQFVCVTAGNSDVVKEIMINVARTSLSSKFSKRTHEHLAQLVVNLISAEPNDIKGLQQRIQNRIDDFHDTSVETCGIHQLSSAVINGIVIQRDFHFVDSSIYSTSPVRMILLDFPVDGLGEERDTVIQVQNEDTLSMSLANKKHRVQCAMHYLDSASVKMIISSVKVTDMVLHECRSLGISVVHMVPEEDMIRLTRECRVSMAGDVAQLRESGIIAEVENVRGIPLGGKQYVQLLGFPKAVSQPRQMHICGPSSGFCQQIRFAVFNTLKTLYMLLDPEHLLNHHCSTGLQHPHLAFCPGGGYIETLFRNTIDVYPFIGKVLSTALLAVPQTLLSNSFRSTAEKSSTHLLKIIQTNELFRINGKSGVLVLPPFDRVCIEPTPSKILLLYHVCELVRQVLRVESLVSVRKLPNGEE